MELSYSVSIECALMYLTCLTYGNIVGGVTYTAGVVEFSPDELLPNTSPQQLILKNADKYYDIITKAANHGVDILVFPECGLTGINIPVVRGEIPAYLTEIPAVGFNPCLSKQAPEVLKKLSCAAREKQLYLVVNLDELMRCSPGESGCPSDGSLFYNTNVAIDRTGTIVSKYRKFNLFIEPEFNITKEPDHSWFDTDFDVRFGMFICFDILFQEPSGPLLQQNISNFVYSTAWFSELPFLTAASVQASWAYNHDVNLLAAGYSNVTKGLTGSGIYAGRDGTLVATFSEHTSTKLLIAKVTSNQRGVKPSPTEEFKFKEEKNSALSFFHANMENYTTVEVTSENTKLVYMNKGFTCSINVVLSSIQEVPKYRLVAFSGLRTYAFVKTVHIEICGIVACADATLSSCSQRNFVDSPEFVLSNISISASSNKNLLTFPITLGQNMLPLHNETYQFKKQEQHDQVEMNMETKQPLQNILTFSIFRNREMNVDSINKC